MKKYNTPTAELVRFVTQDVICTSGNDTGNGGNDESTKNITTPGEQM